MSFTASALILTWVALLLLALVVAGLIRQVHALQRGTAPGAARPAPQGRVGAPVPPVAGVDPVVTRLLLLVDADCAACASLLDGIRRTLAPEIVHRGIALLYADGAVVRPPDLDVRVVTAADDVFDAVGATALPYGVALDTDGRIAAAAPVGGMAELFPLLAAAGLDQADPVHQEVAQ